MHQSVYVAGYKKREAKRFRGTIECHGMGPDASRDRSNGVVSRNGKALTSRPSR